MQTKILPVLSLMLLTVCSVDAQIKKGATLLGGQLGFSSTTTDYSSTPGPSTKNSSFSISPAFGKAVQENLVIGADIDFEYNKFNNQNIDEHKSTVYGIGVFVRQYKELGKSFYLFGQARLGGNYVRFEQAAPQVPSSIQKNYNVQLSFYPGVAYSATRKLQLEAGLNNMVAIQYAHSSSLTTKSNQFSLNTSLNSAMAGFTIGFRVFLN